MTPTSREWIGRILDVLKDGLALHVLEQFRQKYAENYLDQIRDSLSTNSYKPQFTNDLEAISQIDARGWLFLIWDSRKYMFSELETTHHADIDELIEYRDLWAHQHPIPDDKVHRVATMAAELLEHIGAREQAANARRMADRISGVDEKEDTRDLLPITLDEASGFDSEGVTERMPFLWLEIRTKDRDPYQLPLPADKSRIVIGRSVLSSDLPLQDKRVSRVHFQVGINPDGALTITDLHSANGTYLNGQKIPHSVPTSWLRGQSVMVGDTELLLCVDHDPALTIHSNGQKQPMDVPY